MFSSDQTSIIEMTDFPNSRKNTQHSQNLFLFISNIQFLNSTMGKIF